MGNKQLSVVLFVFLCHELAFSSSTLPQLCNKDQSISLLKFKQTLTVDPYNPYNPYNASSSCGYLNHNPYPKTSTWNMSRDCCLWDGVICDEFTGHVIELDLSCSNLVGKFDSNSSLFQLSHLQKLNLSFNDFYPSEISPLFGRFSHLTHLDLSHSYFTGQIPSEISHLSKLQSLYLSGSELSVGPYNFKLLLQNLAQLRELDLTFVRISSTIPPNISSHIRTLSLDYTGLHGALPESIFHLPNLQVLNLGFNNQLSGYFPKTKWNSSASLRVLDLSEVNFYGDFLPESFGYLTSLQSLYLSSCNLSGPIPESLWNLTRIEYMDLHSNDLGGPIPLFISGLPNMKFLSLSSNNLNGEIPSWIYTLPSLTTLDLSYNYFSGPLEDFKSNSLEWIALGGNRLQGHLPMSIQNLVNLTELDLPSNNFSGNVDISLFSNLKQLNLLNLSHNSISIINDNNIKSTLPESLTKIYLSGCEVKELDFLRSAKNLVSLDLSNNNIEGKIPDWAWSNWMHSLAYLNLSHNMLTRIDHFLSFLQLDTLDLRSNFLQGSLPILPSSLIFFFISNNSLGGEIPSFFCNLTLLRVLDLARNNLTGAIPQCLGNLSYGLEVLDMQHNFLSGNLQTTFRVGSRLTSFNLHGNKLAGKIPKSLANCKELEVLDLGNNHLNDTFPMWLGTLPRLQVLSLRSNKLHGPIRASRTKNLFPRLQILDLSCNAFIAELPTSLFQHFKAMMRTNQTKKALGDEYYEDSVVVVTKGLELDVVRILSLYTTIDLSSNKFEGHIPCLLGDLIALRVLNLSHNRLQGDIPSSLGNLSLVETLDLKYNQLSGKIPKQLASLTYLEFLNLSHNHLQGCIPQGPQSHTFMSSSYEDNDGLRGFPVSEGCGNSRIPESSNTTRVLDEESTSEFLSDFWKAALIGYGSGLVIGLSISYIMLSARNPNWLSWIVEELEHKITMRRQKKQRGQTHYRRRRRRRRRRRNNGA
ncbi:receptor-like protein Cf-9 homolog [Nicotiana sylvestris]|uniref:Receptor-like protein 12 n=1 Tax=Nicotiana sylvestris TaxID=4096 RepID=A0A1U7Y3V9_NICSY|nr:PREDICTED: receptor-like protein 12 [Nicotiana sylvestris]XP_009798812.1 PREDICTED: receptor-like protein 12 [Nicotiana sylvestris]